MKTKSQKKSPRGSYRGILAENADFYGQEIEGTEFLDSLFSGSCIIDAKFVDCTFSDVDLSGVYGWYVGFEGCIFEDVNFSLAQLMHSTFDGCQFRSVSFDDANLNGAVFHGNQFWGSVSFEEVTDAFYIFPSLSLASKEATACSSHFVRMHGAKLNNLVFESNTFHPFAGSLIL